LLATVEQEPSVGDVEHALVEWREDLLKDALRRDRTEPESGAFHDGDADRGPGVGDRAGDGAALEVRRLRSEVALLATLEVQVDSEPREIALLDAPPRQARGADP
jgi:hypothetical protein